MTSDRPSVELRQPGVVVVRCEWADQLAPEWQAELLDLSRVASKAGPVALVFVLADRIREIPPTVRGFWRTLCSDRGHRVAAVAVVTSSWSVEVVAAALGVTNALSGQPLHVQAFQDEAEALGWASSIARPAQATAAS